MKRFLILTLLLASNAVIAAYQEAESTRTWTDRSGQHTVEARLVAYDATTRQVRLQQSDGTVIDLYTTDLSRPDRQLLAQIAARERKSTPPAEPAGVANSADSLDGNFEPVTQPDAIDRALDEKTQTVDQPSRRLYGIDWHGSPDAAGLQARGNQSLDDDRPIIWFRVLGDLSGFM